MSWDILIQYFPPDLVDPCEISPDFEPKPLGARDDLLRRLQVSLPAIDFSDPSWGVFRGQGFSIDFNMGSEDTCDSVMLHVSGGDGAVPVIARVLHDLELRAIDCSSGEFFSEESATASYKVWQTYRDTVVASPVCITPVKRWWEFWK